MPAINVRFDDEAWALIKQGALSRKQSIATWIKSACKDAILHQARGRGPEGAALAAELDRRAGKLEKETKR